MAAAAAAAVASSPSSRSFLSAAAIELRTLLLKGSFSSGERKLLHGRLRRLGLDHDGYFLNLLLRSSFISGDHTHAILIFSRASNRNVFHYNTLIRGLVSVDLMTDAIHFYREMRREGFSPDNFTFPFVLKACARLLELETGITIHTHLLKSGFELDVFVNTSLVSLYAKCGRLDDAQRLFDEMPVRNIVSWTAIISGYISDGQLEDAVSIFGKSLEMGLNPDSFTLVKVLTACAKLCDVEKGEWIHKLITEKGLEKNVFVATSLVDMYAKCGRMGNARQVFDEMLEKDVVSWSAMIAGYSSNGLPQEALGLFFKMEAENLKPDCFTLVGVLSACGKLGALELGERVSRHMEMSKILSNPVLGTSLIDMYGKCGSMARSWAVFCGMVEKDLIVWNAMINGLGMTGYEKISFGLFAKMLKYQIRPDGNTFMGLLSACTHSGLVEDGRSYFDSMDRVYFLAPRIEHYGCMVDLLGRAGLLEEANQLIEEMPMEANAIVWGALLGGCKIHRKIDLAEDVLKKLIELEPQNSGNYVLLSNIYASNGRWDESAKLRVTMKGRGIQKIPGYSWVELDGVVHEFHVGDKSHPMTAQIYLKLDELNKQLKAMGYKPTTEVVLFDVEEEEKEHSLEHHSEKLAIAFALINTEMEKTIRVVKNLRVCNDCHSAIKLISRVSCREIIVRDNNRFHRFIDGTCSCGDYW
ncbi:Putative pentatricopeptide repeat-containing protein [Apostasia shenzhenica]|uniref:Pentatricopeptide repeat-containing protein n=1 Tax=Apostasia shenzhenica TaxID=1088818 RepID=A0A2I0BAM0_9ASPA|nr:Putative pentatricopeptide repeat-containing protein [Apostasia shenzhenica]